ncbi:MAG: hypothetical protein ABI351_11075, partial [Herbaspirillum sp.]
MAALPSHRYRSKSLLTPLLIVFMLLLLGGMWSAIGYQIKQERTDSYLQTTQQIERITNTDKLAKFSIPLSTLESQTNGHDHN